MAAEGVRQSLDRLADLVEFIREPEWPRENITCDLQGCVVTLSGPWDNSAGKQKDDPPGSEDGPSEPEEPVATIESFRFPSERPVELQEEIGNLITGRAYKKGAQMAMEEFHHSLLTEEDEKFMATPKNERSASYFMLCEGEEIGTTGDGSMDGTLKIRRRCVSWDLTWIGETHCASGFLEFRGTQPDEEDIGAAYLVYQHQDGEPLIRRVYTLLPGRASKDQEFEAHHEAWADGARRLQGLMWDFAEVG